MRQTIEVSEKIDFIDGFEGHIFCDSFSEGEMFKLKVWGLTILSDLGISEEDVYIASMSDLLFENVIYVYLDLGVYSNEKCNEFIQNMAGDSTHLKLELGKRNNSNEYTEYIFGGTFGRNIGNGEMKIYYKGKVFLSYDDDAVVDVREFCLNPKKYGFQV